MRKEKTEQERIARRSNPLRRKWERKLGQRLAEEFWQKCLEAVRDGPGDEEVALEDLESVVEQYIEVGLLLSFPTSRKPPRGSPPKKRYQRCFEKRLHVVEFVLFRRLSFGCLMPFLADGSIIPLKPLKHFDWKWEAARWNEAHPHDHLTPDSLKVKFYRAVAEEDIQREYLERRAAKVRFLAKQTSSLLATQVEQSLALFRHNAEQALALAAHNLVPLVNQALEGLRLYLPDETSEGLPDEDQEGKRTHDEEGVNC